MNKSILKFYILMFTAIISVYVIVFINVRKSLIDKEESIENPVVNTAINEASIEDVNYDIEKDNINIYETNKNIEPIENVEVVNTLYDEIDIFDETSFSPDVIASNSELFSHYREFMKSLKKNEGVKYYILNKDYVRNLYKKTCFFGDSNVDVLRKRMFLPLSMIQAFPGKSLGEIREKLIDNEVDIRNYKNIIVWTGYVIKYIRDSKHYIDEYDKLIKEIKKHNPDCNIFVCSLLPASKQTIENDIRNGSPHNLDKGKDYDAALSEHFKETYINTKLFIDEDFYSYDGFHMKTEFCDLFFTYVGFFVNLRNLQQ